ncbi:HET domain-containing protein [Fusarium falciforme]|uniref:HET domain-containing protein n=1 Tax=Fusarium falciforme TaxID=195108 RepID=UPI0023004225|nr:HET domain-containing protein [Fusarium falciforme]WAO91573.1 HET domain-containing protein [Fusarium falciforme]
MEAQPTHVHQPLPPLLALGPKPYYTRILTLFPGEIDAPLFCTLQIIDLNHPPFPFEALSYVWGKAKSSEHLFCDDGHLKITVNLDKALRHLRLSSMSRRLLVDAICIDQTDLAERARQVQYMRLVYKRASRVIVWLGGKQDWTETAITFAKELVSLRADFIENLGLPSGGEGAPAGDPAQTEQGRRSDAFSLLSNVYKSNQEGAEALSKLFGCEYFTRVWCIQEVVASSYSIVKLADLEIDMKDLLSLLYFVLDHRGLDLKPTPLQLWRIVYEMPLLYEQLKYSHPEGSIGTMLVVLTSIRDFGATDPRDRIFATLGITDEGLEPIYSITESNWLADVARKGYSWISRRINSISPALEPTRHPALIPNYNKSMREVYQEFTRYCIWKPPRLLTVLGHVQHHEDPETALDFPSWVPRFDQCRIVSKFISELSDAGVPTKLQMYIAETHDNPFHPSSPFSNPIKEPDILQLNGFQVDTICAATDVFMQEADGTFSPASLWSQLFPHPLFPREPGQVDQYQFSKMATDVAFLQTLCAGGMLSACSQLINSSSRPGKTRQSRLEQSRRLAAQAILRWLRERPEVDCDAYPDLGPPPIDEFHVSPMERYQYQAVSLCANRKVYRTATGILGLGPKFLKPGDCIVVLFGGSFPIVLRPRGRNWILIGETYLHHDEVCLGQLATRAKSRKSQVNVTRFRIR